MSEIGRVVRDEEDVALGTLAHIFDHLEMLIDEQQLLMLIA
jgi:hypothetical protein